MRNIQIAGPALTLTLEDLYYNRTRLHCCNGYLSPVLTEKKAA